MKKLIMAAFVIAVSAFTAQADIKDILQGLGGNKTQEQPAAEQPASGNESTKSGGLGDLLGGLESIGSKLGVIPARKVDVAYLQGTWSYRKPAVAFKSENFLAKAGGVAASAKVESELKPYYEKVGFDKMTLTVASDSTFTMKLARGSLTGTISSAPADGTLTFRFKVLGMNIGSMTAYVNAENAKTMSITFDVSKLLVLIEKVAAFSGSTSMKALSGVLSNYDGMTAGFNMVKTADAPATTSRKR